MRDFGGIKVMDHDRVERLHHQNGTETVPTIATDAADQVIVVDAEGAEGAEVSESEISCSDDQALPHINITDKFVREITATALGAMERLNAALKPEYFQQAGHLVRLLFLEDGQNWRPTLSMLSKDQVFSVLARLVDWYKMTRAGEVKTDPPPNVVRDILAVGEYPLPHIKRIAEAPLFDKDGRIIAALGYNPESCIYLYLTKDLEGLAEVSPEPSAIDVSEALRLIRDELFVDFPFVASPDYAHALAALILPFIREMIDSIVPMHAITAPKAGTGKGKLADAITMVATGRPMPISDHSVTNDSNELRKHITGLMIATGGSAILAIDNIAAILRAPTLAALLTAPVWQDRVLGHSRIVQLPNRLMLFITGNNLVLGGDLPRRVVPIRLDADMEHPEERKNFKHNLDTWLPVHRHTLVWAILTLVQNWIARGRPEFTDRTLGSYERWTRIAGGILLAADVPGFLEVTGHDLTDTDGTPDAGWRGFIQAWHRTYGDQRVVVNDLFELADPTLGSLLGNGNDSSKRQHLAAELNKHRGQVVAAFKQVTDDAKDHCGRRYWRLIPHNGSEKVGIFGSLGANDRADATDAMNSSIDGKPIDEYSSDTDGQDSVEEF